jgi:hypothetical protein
VFILAHICSFAGLITYIPLLPLPNNSTNLHYFGDLPEENYNEGISILGIFVEE